MWRPRTGSLHRASLCQRSLPRALFRPRTCASFFCCATCGAPGPAAGTGQACASGHCQGPSSGPEQHRTEDVAESADATTTTAAATAGAAAPLKRCQESPAGSKGRAGASACSCAGIRDASTTRLFGRRRRGWDDLRFHERVAWMRRHRLPQGSVGQLLRRRLGPTCRSCLVRRVRGRPHVELEILIFSSFKVQNFNPAALKFLPFHPAKFKTSAL